MGRPQADNQKVFNGVLWILRIGAPWRDLPEYYGSWQTVYKWFAQWQENGKLKALFDQLREGADMQDLSIDGTYIKAHRASVGVKKGMRTIPKTSPLVLQSLPHRKFSISMPNAGILKYSSEAVSRNSPSTSVSFARNKALRGCG